MENKELNLTETEAFENSEKAKQLANYRLPRYEELIKFDIFMNQLTNILDEYLSVFLIPGEAKILTSSMINNYVYNNVIMPPEHKKYSKIHLIHLIAIGLLKQVLSIPDIAEIISMQIKQYPIDVAYNYFCIEVENAMKVTFERRGFGEIDKTQPKKVTPLTKKVRSAALSFANKIYVKQSIYYETHNQKK